MRTQIKIALASMLVTLFAAFGAQVASASFGLIPGSVDSTALDEEGNFFSQAAGHPFELTTKFTLKSVPDTRPEFEGHEVPEGGSFLRQVTVEAPPRLGGKSYRYPEMHAI